MKTETKALIIDSLVFGGITLPMVIVTIMAFASYGFVAQSFVCLAMSVIAIALTSTIVYIRIKNYLDA